MYKYLIYTQTHGIVCVYGEESEWDDARLRIIKINKKGEKQYGAVFCMQNIDGFEIQEVEDET